VLLGAEPQTVRDAIERGDAERRIHEQLRLALKHEARIPVGRDPKHAN
jgi:hypothetical protein